MEFGRYKLFIIKNNMKILLSESIYNILSEAKNVTHQTYHNTYSSAVDEALEFAKKRGYTVDGEEVSREVTLNKEKPKPKEGETNRFSLSLKKDGKEQKMKLHFQIYGMREKYELNVYIS